MIVRDGTFEDIKELRKLARRITIFAEQRRTCLEPTEAVGVAVALQTAIDTARELYYMLSETLDDLETEE